MILILIFAEVLGESLHQSETTSSYHLTTTPHRSVRSYRCSSDELPFEDRRHLLNEPSFVPREMAQVNTRPRMPITHYSRIRRKEPGLLNMC